MPKFFDYAENGAAELTSLSTGSWTTDIDLDLDASYVGSAPTIPAEATGVILRFVCSTGTDYAFSIRTTSDGGFIIAGGTTSYGSGGWDIWVIKLNEFGECTPLDSDTAVTPQIPSPSSFVPSDVVINANLGSSNTECTVNEDPQVISIQLVP